MDVPETSGTIAVETIMQAQSHSPGTWIDMQGAFKIDCTRCLGSAFVDNNDQISGTVLQRGCESSREKRGARGPRKSP